MSYIKRFVVDEIVDLYLNGKSNEEIAVIFNCSVDDISVITENLNELV